MNRLLIATALALVLGVSPFGAASAEGDCQGPTVAEMAKHNEDGPYHWITREMSDAEKAIFTVNYNNLPPISNSTFDHLFVALSDKALDPDTGKPVVVVVIGDANGCFLGAEPYPEDEFLKLMHDPSL